MAHNDSTASTSTTGASDALSIAVPTANLRARDDLLGKSLGDDQTRGDHAEAHGDDHAHGFDWLEAARIAVAAICAAGSWFAEAFFFAPGSIWEGIHDWAAQFDPWPVLALVDYLPGALKNALPTDVVNWIDYYLALPFSTYAAVGLAFSGWPIFKEAFHNLRQRRMTMELSMTIAILAGVYTGYFFVTLLITFFVLVAEVLEGLTVERGRRAIRDLLELLPREVTVRRFGQISEVKTADLSIGETVLVAPGGRIPVDGAVVGGHSFVDESRITGESMPVEKVSGALVFAGTINQSGVLEVRAERIGADTSYGKIIEAVERAERSRAPITRIADQLAGYIVIFAMAFAAATQYLWGDVNTSISVLVVSGACGVAAGTPLAILGAIGRAARLGAIVKGGVHLEMLSRVDTVVLDKTGTLTFGTPRVKSVVTAAGVAADSVLAAAASAELRSEHPLGKAIVEYARAAGAAMVEPGRFDYTPGRGIAAAVGEARVLVGNEFWMRENGVDIAGLQAATSAAASNIFVARDGRLLGVIAVADAVRPEAREAVAAMQRKGIRVILLTGDNAPVAQAVAHELGIAEVEANQLPEAKLERIRQLVAERRIVAMVGDGVNDAPALAAAHVGVAMGSGTDVARESADVVLIGNDLARFADTLGVSRRARGIIWQNFAGTIVVDISGIALAMMGMIGPVAAVQIHTGSELLFILNSARLLPRWSPFKSRGAPPATDAPPPGRPAVGPRPGLQIGATNRSRVSNLVPPMKRLRTAWPWRDRSGGFSWLKTGTLAVLLCPAASMLYDLRVGNFGPLPIVGLIYWSGVWATALLLLTLAVAPARGIFRWNKVIAVRRMIGVAALAYTLAHLVIYFALDRWDFRYMTDEVSRRLTLVVATVSLIGLICLGGTSFDAAVQRMGNKVWKRLHRANYLLTLLAVVHYLLSPGMFSTQYFMAGVLFWLMAWRVLDRYGFGAEPDALAALAVASALFTVVLEAGWMWAYHHMDPGVTLADNFSLEWGLSAAWQVLALGLLVALAAAVSRFGMKWLPARGRSGAA